MCAVKRNSERNRKEARPCSIGTDRANASIYREYGVFGIAKIVVEVTGFESDTMGLWSLVSLLVLLQVQ